MSTTKPLLRAEPIHELGRTAVRKGLPEIGKGLIRFAGKLAKAHPIGAVLDEIGVLDGLGKALGVDPESPNQMREKLENLSPDQVAAKVRLAELEQEMAIANIEAETIREQEATKRIEAVNETIRAEVLANPEAGAWRPMWGRWSCVGFWSMVAGIMAGVLTDLICHYAVENREAIFIPNLPLIVGAFTALMTLPAAILGTASHHRGVEKRVLAGEERETITVKKT